MVTDFLRNFYSICADYIFSFYSFHTVYIAVQQKPPKAAWGLAFKGF